MKFTLADYKILNIKQYIKSTNLCFFLSGLDQDSIKTKQKLKNINFNYYKTVNRMLIKMLKSSIYKNVIPIVTCTTFFMIPTLKEPLAKNNLFNTFEDLMFIFLANKLNNKIYLSHQLKNINFLNYHKSSLLFYQFLINNLKNKYLH